MIGWQWHQLDYMHIIICISLPAGYHATTSSLGCYRPDALPNAGTTVSNTARVLASQAEAIVDR